MARSHFLFTPSTLDDFENNDDVESKTNAYLEKERKRLGVRNIQFKNSTNAGSILEKKTQETTSQTNEIGFFEKISLYFACKFSHFEETSQPEIVPRDVFTIICSYLAYKPDLARLCQVDQKMNKLIESRPESKAAKDYKEKCLSVKKRREEFNKQNFNRQMFFAMALQSGYNLSYEINSPLGKVLEREEQELKNMKSKLSKSWRPK